MYFLNWKSKSTFDYFYTPQKITFTQPERHIGAKASFNFQNVRKKMRGKGGGWGLGTSLASWHLWVQWGVCVLNKWLGRFSPCASHVRITHADLVTLGSAKTQHKPFPLGRLPWVRPRLCLGPCIFIPGCLFIFPQLKPVTSKRAPALHPLNLPPGLLLEEPPSLREQKDWTLNKV